MKFSKFTTLVLLAAIITCSNTVYAKENVRASKAKRLIIGNLVRLQEHKKNPNAILNRDEITDEVLAQADPNEILLAIAPYKKDEDYNLKSMAFFIERRLAHIHKHDIKLRQRVVDSHVEAHVTRSMSTYNDLKRFTQKDFSKNSKNIILNELKGKQPHRHIEICGVANIPEALPILEKMLFDETEYQLDPTKKTARHMYTYHWYYQSGWKARLARARMGVKDDINKCVSLIEHDLDTKDKDDIDEHDLLFDLGYIRQPESIESLKKYFLSDRRRQRIDEWSEGQPYSESLMPILYENLSNFPVKKSPINNYTKEEIDACKKWMARQKKWKINR